MTLPDETVEAMARAVLACDYSPEWVKALEDEDGPAWRISKKRVRAAVALLPEPPISAAPEGWKPIKPREAFALWKACGGAQHGPNVEHYSIKESDWPKFIMALNEAATPTPPAEQVKP